MKKQRQWLRIFIGIVAAINLIGIATMLLGGGLDPASSNIAASQTALRLFFASTGRTFYAWSWMILPCSVFACMLAGDLAAANDEKRLEPAPRLQRRVANERA